MSKWSAAFRDSRWQKKRLDVMNRDGWRCQSCGDYDGATLNVHHAFYEKNKAPWEYPDETLSTLCEACHTKLHAMSKKLMVGLAKCNVNKACYAIGEIIDYMNIDGNCCYLTMTDKGKKAFAEGIGEAFKNASYQDYQEARKNRKSTCSKGVF